MTSGPSPSPIVLLEEPNAIKQWTCIECDQAFSQSKLLETHAVETDHKAYRCTKERACGKLFTLRSSWIRHERSHSAQKSHACSRCRKRFHRKDNCHDHERTCGRVSQRARVTSHLASTSPTISGTTRSVTPIDLFTPRLIGNEYEKAIPSASRGPNVPPKSSPLPSAGYYPPTDITPPGYPTTTVLGRTANHPLEADHNALFLLDDDNTENHTIPRNVASQPAADSDWKQWLRFFQSQETAPPFELGSPEEHWEIETSLEPCPVPDSGLFSLSDTRNPRRQDGHLYRQCHIGSERKPRSKIATFLSKLRAYIKAPFRRRRQRQYWGGQQL